VLAARAVALNCTPLDRVAVTRGSQDDVTSAVVDVGGAFARCRYLERVVGAFANSGCARRRQCCFDDICQERVDVASIRGFFRSDMADPNTPLALKFPKPRVSQDENVRQSIVRETGRPADRDEGVLAPIPVDARQTRLYVVMPLGAGVRPKKLLAAPQPMALRCARDRAACWPFDRRADLAISPRDIKTENVR